MAIQFEHHSYPESDDSPSRQALTFNFDLCVLCSRAILMGVV